MADTPAPSAEKLRQAAPISSGTALDPIRVPGGRSFVGTNSPEIPVDGEGPERPVTLRDFALEATTVTNARFADFVAATGYVTEAERYGWSAVFHSDRESLDAATRAGSQLPWWHKVDGVSWRHPEGPDSSLEGREDHPVVQVSWRDANAFAQWVGGRLPTEAEWEHAARGGTERRRFPWGDEEPNDHDAIFCNIWQGRFPDLNTARDGFVRTAPARSFESNPLGFYSMSGNVWEWTHDAFRVRSVSRAAKQRNAYALQHSEKVLKGGSFLCHVSYCYRYRIAARMAMTPDSAGSNTGFRVAYDVQ
ncbi:formylglycine-generating enzyme family protein [Pelagibacterium halotolerans]|uniref:Sulfatase modifying factor 1 (C-alpha-formyglycine-generating enzyme 1) n=1 Tax=Pelagibacterium halotolerans (strain DSM 22347 / JCM 15775 / CGMCC 1.7692 / B2) TaxID=1082931 RepID=G4R7D7_PELHB|nr:formylglycine-generating enzyme family protein [Pelagibacterium halotolerans]AEQ51273.1 sulfatase modifying factor 1 precursor (C-alpha-formyglycine- generating enzyme 1) [Pelagibacterium halotolerans B2]QJR18870.1 formylglycine-generating enzyme family protein [Pelagibacterium halotolerans]